MDDFRGSSFQWGNDYITEYDEAEDWIIEPLLPVGGLMNLYGKPKTGKSFLAYGIAIAVSSGAPTWNELPIGRHGPVMYFQIDTPRGSWKRRSRVIVEAGYDISRIAMLDMRMAPYPYNILTPTHQAWLRTQIEAVNPVLIIVDTIREIHEEDENASDAMRKVMGQIVKLANGAAVIFLSHSRKDSALNQSGTESDMMDEGRGSSYVSGRMDTIGRLTQKYLTYKGRDVEQTKMPVVMDPESHLIVLEGSAARLEQFVMQVLREQPETSQRKQSQWVADQMKGQVSARTVERRIKKHLSLLTGSKPEPSPEG